METVLKDGETGAQAKILHSGALVVCPEHHHQSYGEEFTADANGDLTAVILVPPASDTLDIHSIRVDTDGNSGVIALDFATSGIKIMRVYVSREASADYSLDHTGGKIGEGITLTTDNIGNGGKAFVKIVYVIHSHGLD